MFVSVCTDDTLLYLPWMPDCGAPCALWFMDESRVRNSVWILNRQCTTGPYLSRKRAMTVRQIIHLNGSLI
jgi:predicted RNA-binding Zn ribbon-like protein